MPSSNVGQRGMLYCGAKLLETIEHEVVRFTEMAAGREAHEPVSDRMQNEGEHTQKRLSRTATENEVVT